MTSPLSSRIAGWFLLALACVSGRLATARGELLEQMAPLRIDRAPSALIDANGDSIQVSVRVDFSSDNTSLAQPDQSDYQVHFQLVDSQYRPQPIRDRQGATVDRWQEPFQVVLPLCLDGGSSGTCGISTSATNFTFGARLQPVIRLDPVEPYFVLAELFRRDPITGTFNEVHFRSAGPRQFIHFQNGSAPDASLNVVGTLDQVGNRTTYLVQGVPGQEEFRVAAAYTLWRWDDSSLPTRYDPVAVELHVAMRVAGTSADVPLRQSRFLDSVPVRTHLPSGAPANARRTTVLSFAPAIQLDSVQRLYEVEVTLVHLDADGTPIQANALSTAPARFLHFNGDLRFGEVRTRMDSLVASPVPTVKGAVGATVPVELAGVGGALEAARTMRWTLPTSTVELDPEGVAHYQGPPITLSAGCLQQNVRNVRVNACGLELGPDGAVGDLTVGLPTGLGFSRRLDHRVLETSLKFSRVRLNGALEPRNPVLVFTAAPNVQTSLFAFHEQLPLWLETLGIAWRVGSGEFELGNGLWRYCREPELSFLENSVPAGERVDATSPERPSNDLALRTARTTSGRSVMVRADSQGRGRLDASVEVGGGGFLTHFPRRVALRHGGGALHIADGHIQAATSTLAPDAVDPAVTLGYPHDCGGQGCDRFGVEGQAKFEPGPEGFRFTRDGGLWSAGTLDPFTAEWGTVQCEPNTPTDFAHRAGVFRKGVLAIAGHILRGDDSFAEHLKPEHRAAALLLSGLGSTTDPERVERPWTAAYEQGLGNYPGLNLRVESVAVNGRSLLACQSTGDYPLKPRSKYYLRPAGVSGVHDAAGFNRQLTLYGFPVGFTTLQLAFLDSQNTDSRTDGNIAVKYPSGFKLDFEELHFGCRGQLGVARLPAGTTEQPLVYWLTKITPLSIEFRQPIGPNGCSSPSQGFLALGVETRLPLVPGKLAGLLGFNADGNLVSAGDTVALGTGIDSRLALPAVLSIRGPNKQALGTPPPPPEETAYEFNPVSKGYFSRWPGLPNGAKPGDEAWPGFVNLFGKLRLPFFESMKVHVQALPQQEQNAWMMGGWNSSDSQPAPPGQAWTEPGDLTPFNHQRFDALNRGFPPALPDPDAYRDYTTAEYNARVRKVWLDIVKFDSPLAWSPLTKSFRSQPAAPPQPVALFKLENHIHTLTARHAEVAFNSVRGAGPNFSRFDPSALLYDEIEGRIGLARSVTDAIQDASAVIGITGAMESLDDLTAEQVNGLFGPMFRSIGDSIVDPVVEKLNQAVGNGRKDAAALCQELQSVGGIVDNALDEARNSATVLRRLTDDLQEAVDRIEEGATNLLSILELKPAQQGKTPQRQLVQEILKRVVADQRGSIEAELTVSLGAISDELIAETMTEIEPQLAETESVLGGMVAEIQDLKKQLREGTGSFHAELQQVLGSLGTANALQTSIRESFCHALQSQPDAAGNLFNQAALKDLRGELGRLVVERLLADTVPQQFKFLLKSRFSNGRGIFRQTLDQLFESIHTTIREIAVQKLTETGGALTQTVSKALGALDEVFEATNVEGFARINQNSVEELRLNGRFDLQLHKSELLDQAVEQTIAVNGYALVRSWDSTSPAHGCLGVGEMKSEVLVGATAAPGGAFGKDMRVGLEGKVLYGQTGSVLGLEGGLRMTGNRKVGRIRIVDPAFSFVFGKQANYIGGSFSGDIKGVSVDVRAFFGTACNLASLGASIPDLELVLSEHGLDKNGQFSGFYVVGDGSYSLSKLFLDLDFGCVLRAVATGGYGAYGLIATEPQTRDAAVIAGLRYRMGLRAELFCTASAAGEFTLLGSGYLSNNQTALSLVGHGFVEARFLMWTARKNFDLNESLKLDFQ